ncbi:MAG: DsbC family protein [Deltaproteobacteria bacterium]|nr:DsbC family protein [Deltaproteobacteria bacterium]
MLRYIAIAVFLLANTILPAAADDAVAFQGPGCMGKCTDCHSLNKDEAGKLLKTDKFKAEIKDIRMSPVKGLWEVEGKQADKTFRVYMDFAKKFLVEAKFTKLDQIGEAQEQQPLKRVDIKKIPLENAVVYGNPKASKRIIVFDDPDCPYCKKLHDEIKKVIAKRKDVVFYIKLFPLPMHPEAYAKSKTVICRNKSPKLLDDAFAGKTLPKPECETAEIDDNIKLANELGIRGTPGIIFPDGRLLPGYVPADTLLTILDNPAGQAVNGEKKD